MIATDRTSLSPRTHVRSAIDFLHQLDPDTARYLDAVAFVLMRVAEADHQVTTDETLRMEEALRMHQALSADQAALVVEIARHRLRHADAGGSYSVTRDLRHRLRPEERARLLPLLRAVAEADGHRCDFERATIDQIAWELGFERGAALS